MRTLILFPILAAMAGTAPAKATTLTTIYGFQGSSDGGCPTGPLHKDSNGNLFVTAGCGGDNNNGTVVELMPPATIGANWTSKVLVMFDGAHLGGVPGGGVIPDGHGGYWGTAYNGGYKSAGTVFDLRPPTATNLNWRLALRWSFKGGIYGAHPNPGLVAGGPNTVFGTTNQGGKNNKGIVFKIAPPVSGNTYTKTDVWTFTGGSDGGNPASAPVMDSGGAMYGTTTSGGAHGFGTIYKLTPSGGSYTLETLYDFTGGLDGAAPQGTLLLNGGNLYGICEGGGAGSPAIGTVWRLVAPSVMHTPGWVFQKMWGFSGGTDGTEPMAGISRVGSTFYSSGYYKGAAGAGAGYGALIALDRTGPNTWAETNLIQFNQGNGAWPGGTLVPGPSGTLYGSTVGGILGWGSIFQLTP